MGCACSNKRCHFHFRKLWKLPTEVTEDTIESLIDGDEFQSWLNDEYAMKSQYEYVGLSKLIDGYWWSLLLVSIGYILSAHIIAIIQPWATCTYYGFPKDDREISIACSVTWHVISIPVVVFWIVVAIYGLRYWSHEQIRIIWNMIGWSNIVTFGKAVAEIAGILIITHNEEVMKDVPLYQVVFFWVYTLMLLGVTAYGMYIQYRINDFLYPKEQDYRLVYPSSEDEIISLVKKAYNNNMTLRVVGSEHSQKPAIWGENTVATIMVSLDNYRDIVSWDDEKMQVTVEGGIILGRNDKEWSKWKNGLCYQINEKGWALPDLGGVVKQTAGGFTMMGCAGGTMMYDYNDSIYSIRFIDGTGTPRVITRPDPEGDDPDNPFWAGVVSMGLYGVVSTITYQCTPKFNIIGSQVTMTTKQFAKTGDQSGADGVGKVNFHAKSNDDPESVYQLFMSDKNKHYACEYSRFYWYPQTSKGRKDQNWIVLWKAHREVTEEKQNPYAPGIDSAQKEYKELYPKGEGSKLKDKPYHEIAKSPIASYMAQVLVHFLYNIFGASVNPDTHKVSDLLVGIIDFVISLFVSPKINEGIADQVFGSKWYRTLPMDQAINDNKMPFEFTELWINIEDTTKTINAIWEYFGEDDNFNKMGIFAWEFYVAKEDKTWIRPNYQQKSFRVDILWYDIQTRVPYTFYNEFWEFLIEKGIDFRPHWGKWVPAGVQEFPTSKDPKNRGFKKWSEYYASILPKFNDFKQLRKEFDPRNVFLTDYWMRILDINDGDSVGVVVNGENGGSKMDRIQYLLANKMNNFKTIKRK